jgi:hypothetical protein
MRFRLRTLLILLAVGPPVLAGAWWAWPFVTDVANSLASSPWDSWRPLLELGASVAALIAIVTLIGALARWLGYLIAGKPTLIVEPLPCNTNMLGAKLLLAFVPAMNIVNRGLDIDGRQRIFVVRQPMNCGKEF